MRILSKVTGIVAILAIIISLFTGCNAEEMELYSAMEKLIFANYMESKTDIKVTLETDGVTSSENSTVQMIEQMKPMINSSIISIEQKMYKNDEGTKLQAELITDMDFMNQHTSKTVWSEYDLTSKDPSFKFISQVPDDNFLPKRFQGKQYEVRDTKQLVTMRGFDSLASLATTLTPKFRELFREYAIKFAPGFNFITKTGEKSYRITISDANLKALVKYIIEDMGQNETALEIVKEVIYAGSNPESAAKEFEQFKSQLPTTVTYVNQFLDAFKDVPILGEGGIVVDYLLDDQGYVIKETEKIPLLIDYQKWTAAIHALAGEKMPLDDEGLTGIYKLTLDISTDISNINKYDKVASMPVITNENSYSYSDYEQYQNHRFDKLVQSERDDSGNPVNVAVDVEVDGQLIDFPEKPIMVDSTVLVPVREMANALGAEVLWDGSQKTVKVAKDGKEILFKVGTKTAIVNGETINLNTNVISQNNKTYVPVRFICEELSASVEWDDYAYIVVVSSLQ